MPAVATIRQIAYQAFMLCRTDRELFSTLVKADVRELGYSRIIVSLVERLSLMLFDHWSTVGVEDRDVPEDFLTLYSQTSMD